MKDPSASRSAPRLAISEEVVKSLRASTAAGNSGARVTLRGVCCPWCAKLSLSAAAVFRSANVTGYVRHRHFDVVTACQAAPCAFAADTSGRFSLAG